MKEKEEQVRGLLELLEFEQSKWRKAKLLIADAKRRENQLEMLRSQLSEELGQKAQMEEALQCSQLQAAQMEEALQCSQLQAATALSELEEEQRKANRLGQQLREREGTIRGLREFQTSGGLDVMQRSLTITREEEWQSMLDERTQKMETMSEQLSQLQKQVEFANTQSEMFWQTINTTKQSAQQQASALQQNFEAKSSRSRMRLEFGCSTGSWGRGLKPTKKPGRPPLRFVRTKTKWCLDLTTNCAKPGPTQAG